MGRPTLSRLRLCGLAALALVLLLAGLAFRQGWLPRRVSDVWPLQLGHPGGWLIDRQLMDLRSDPGLCREVLRAPQIEAGPVADNREKSGCGWSNAWRIATLGGAKLEAGPVSCDLAAALALWLEHAVQPAARRNFGRRVTAIEHLGAYACRGMRGSPAVAGNQSEHARANALDVRGFLLDDGRRVRVATGWGGAGAEGRFLADVHKGACTYFRVALGPAYNAAHRDHFHLDRGPWRSCR